MKISILTLGCRTNQAESMQLEHSLASRGHRLVSEDPDLCIINTCAVTAGADHQSQRLIQRMVQAGKKVIVTGCYGELNQESLERIPGEISFVKNSEKNNIINIVDSITSEVTRADSIVSLSQDSSHKRFILKVQDGCNYSCSYCAIPLARGRSRSYPLNEIIEKVRECESMGYKEVVLTGIHLGTYGADLSPGMGLAYLIEEILSQTGIHRIRLSSLEVREVDSRIIDLLQDRRICKHLHVPLQSGDDNILKLMNRSYSCQAFLHKMEEIFSTVPDIGLGTDVIVGFPGEGEAEFRNTRRLLERLPFSYLHVFPYSQRPKTMAATFSNQVAGKVKKERASELRALGEEKKRSFVLSHLGRIVDLIVEERSGDEWSGTTGNYIKAVLTGRRDLQPGMVVNARITGYEKGIAVAVAVEREEALQL